jgi:hypothetical protein
VEAASSNGQQQIAVGSSPCLADCSETESICKLQNGDNNALNSFMKSMADQTATLDIQKFIFSSVFRAATKRFDLKEK